MGHHLLIIHTDHSLHSDWARRFQRFSWVQTLQMDSLCKPTYFAVLVQKYLNILTDIDHNELRPTQIECAGIHTNTHTHTKVRAGQKVHQFWSAHFAPQHKAMAFRSIYC